jgi:hypothetical protein
VEIFIAYRLVMTTGPGAHGIGASKIVAIQAGFEVSFRFTSMIAAVAAVGPTHSQRMRQYHVAAMTIDAFIPGVMADQTVFFLADRTHEVCVFPIQGVDSSLKIHAFVTILAKRLSVTEVAARLVGLGDGAVSPAKIQGVIRRRRHGIDAVTGTAFLRTVLLIVAAEAGLHRQVGTPRRTPQRLVIPVALSAPN